MCIHAGLERALVDPSWSETLETTVIGTGTFHRKADHLHCTLHLNISYSLEDAGVTTSVMEALPVIIAGEDRTRNGLRKGGVS